MNPPEKLFQNGPEWKPTGEYQWGCSGDGWGATIKHSAATESCSATYCGQWERFRDFATAVWWLRARIIAHRDELVRVTG